MKITIVSAVKLLILASHYQFRKSVAPNESEWKVNEEEACCLRQLFSVHIFLL